MNAIRHLLGSQTGRNSPRRHRGEGHLKAEYMPKWRAGKETKAPISGQKEPARKATHDASGASSGLTPVTIFPLASVNRWSLRFIQVKHIKDMLCCVVDQ